MARKFRRTPVSSDKRFKRNVADTGPAERWQHSGRLLEYTEQAGVFAARATEEHVLDRLVLLNHIDAPARDAGLRLQEDYCMARIEGPVTASYSVARRTGADPEARLQRGEIQEMAYRRWKRALRMFDVDIRSALCITCCSGYMPSTAMLPALKKGLHRLVWYYGLVK